MQKCVIYVRENTQPDIYTQFNECARYASRYGISIEYKVFDSRGDRLQEAINKAVFTDHITDFIVYSRKTMCDDMEEMLFHHIYITHFGVNVHFID